MVKNVTLAAWQEVVEAGEGSAEKEEAPGSAGWQRDEGGAAASERPAPPPTGQVLAAPVCVGLGFRDPLHLVPHVQTRNQWRRGMQEPQQQVLKFAKLYGVEYPKCHFCEWAHEIDTCTGPAHLERVWSQWEKLKNSRMTYGDGRRQFWQDIHCRQGVVLWFNHLDGALEIWHDSRGASSPLVPPSCALPAFPSATRSLQGSFQKAEAEKALLQERLLEAYAAIRSLERRLRESEAAKTSLENELQEARANNDACEEVTCETAEVKKVMWDDDKLQEMVVTTAVHPIRTVKAVENF